MRSFALVSLGLAVAAAMVSMPSEADYIFRPPVAAKSLLDAQNNPLPVDTVNGYLEHVDSAYTYDVYAGQNEALAEACERPGVYMMSDGFPTDLGSDVLFGQGYFDGEFYVHLVAINSVDAVAIRLLVDLSSLEDTEEVWVLDPTVPRAFGPWYLANAKEGGLWLSTVEGEVAVLMVRSTNAIVPQIRLLGISHFYRLLPGEKVLSCNVNVACETDTSLQEISTGVGYMEMPIGLFGMGSCSGVLIANPDTAADEPYFLTSEHCVDETSDPTDIEVYWDYRSSACSGGRVPSLSSLPRSQGKKYLAKNATLDCALLQLESVPTGSYGRAWAIGSTAALSANQDVVTMHYPDGSYMRVSYGTIKRTLEARTGYSYQTRVHWDRGVTEDGSSGSPLLLADAGYAVVGTLSNGYDHSCDDNTNNIDWYTSFRYFYSDIQAYVSGTETPDDTSTDCPIEASLKDSVEVLAQLRAIRDSKLLTTEAGRQFVKAYYDAAPALANAVRRSPQLKSAVAVFASTCAYWAAK